MSPHNALPAVRHMLNHAREALDLAARHSRADLDSARTFTMLLTHLMEIVGKASRRVPDEFRQQYPGTDWRGFAGLRDVLIHKFDDIQYGTLWGIVQDELPALIGQLEEIIERESPV